MTKQRDKDLTLFIQRLPEAVRVELEKHDLDNLIEVVMDIGRIPEARFTNDVTIDLGDMPMTIFPIQHMANSLAFGDDNRAGIDGTLHRLSAIRDRTGTVVGLTCRYVPRNLRNIPSVYIIKNITNDKVYIGSSITLRRRIQEHFRDLISNSHSNKHLQNSFNLHGLDSFTVDVLEYCDRDTVYKVEQYYIDKHGIDSLYNISAIVGNPENKDRIFSEEHRQRISEAKKGNTRFSEETKRKMSESHKGKTLSKEQVIKLTIASTGRLHSEESKKKMSEIKKNIPISQATREARQSLYPSYMSPEGIIFPSGKNLSAFCREHELSPACMRRVEKGITASHKGWTLANA